MTRVLSGIQPSGEVHLGNYIGALRRWAQDQHRVEAFHMIADLHAVTVPHEPVRLRERTLELAAILFAVGLDPDRATVFVQSHVHEHAELTWLLNCVATMGELSRMVQWKEKSKEQGESVSVGLFDYPVLQAADILLYDADEVPVGEDQRQHVELTRDIAQRFNHRFGEVFVVPEATTPAVGARIMDLQRPDAKMSKSSESPKGTILLLDEPDDIRRKVMSAVTDSGTEVRADPVHKRALTNLLELYSAVSDEGVPALEQRYGDGGYAPFKRELAEAVVAFVRPVQERYRELAGDPGHVSALLARGADKARAIAAETLERARGAMGFLPAGQR